ncbi:uncharacterized protein LOC124124497 isoform X2 [Haliotis rufescens]|uniref:uncharacterized protein LOC124124497 isoform X2 n=1 Tax=Haliotis rufescens TaxID=6454 RepID=UPI00201E7D01|nr:uncharacterized protein LOC124124497 isoform X2 [Haliotis rufescens]XP_046343638.2 uncharacterized protein LOC124124497 isoform X2 [Haliotis rufescens]XP_046343639.2 uncharacterized protein LOC124124497 isoform X2 [Haliotis rufescens]
MTVCADLTTKASNASLTLSTTSTTVNTTVTVTCSDSSQRLVGESQLTCLATAEWSDGLPICIRDFSDREIIILAVTCSVIFTLIVVLVLIVLILARRKSRTKRKRHERLAQTMERLSIRDPLDELVRRESRRSSMGYMNDSLNSLPNTNGDISKRRLYKVWTNDRSRKTFAFADDLEELVDRGRDKLGIRGKVQVVLEEDGTEIDNDEILRACSGKVMLLKPISDSWRDSRMLTALDTLPPDSTRF